VRLSILHLKATLQPIDAQAMAITKADWAARLANPAAASASPSSRPQLLELNQQRKDAVQQEIDALNTALGPDSSAKLKDFLEDHFARYSAAAAPLTPALPTPVHHQAQVPQEGVQP